MFRRDDTYAPGEHALLNRQRGVIRDVRTLDAAYRPGQASELYTAMLSGQRLAPSDVQRMMDSAGALITGQLEQVDQKIHRPLVAYTYTRDIDLRTDLSLGHEVSSFLKSGMHAVGGVNATGMALIGAQTSELSTVGVDIGKTMNPLHLWGKELSWSFIEAARDALNSINGTSLENEQIVALQTKWNLDADMGAYVGNAERPGWYGLCNHPAFSVMTAGTTSKTGVTGSQTAWANKAPADILADVNKLLTSIWINSQQNYLPTHLLLPFDQFAYLNATQLGTPNDTTLLQYILKNNITAAHNQTLTIRAVKWLKGRGIGGVDRAVAYVKDYDCIRYPMVPCTAIGGTQIQALQIKVPYVGALGQLEVVRESSAQYLDGI